MKIAIVSGWFGSASLKEYYRFDDGRSDMIIRLLEALKKDNEVTTEIELICKHRESFDIEIHINWQRRVTNAAKSYLIMLEDWRIRPQNLLIKFFNNYDLVFGWNEDDSKLGNWKKIWFPHNYFSNEELFNNRRKLLLTSVSSNRNVLFDKKSELYSLRYNDIEYFNINETNFRFYGHRWDIPFVKPGLISRLIEELDKRVVRFKRKVELTTYGGAPTRKLDVLSDAYFSMCYENIKYLNGYISEKVLDCFSCYTIPIYYPSYDIPESVIPSNCYIDRRKFTNVSDLHAFIISLSDEDILRYQIAIREFNRSMSYRFSIDSFVNEVLDGIDA